MNADTAASAPATRLPIAATATTTTTSSKATLEFGQAARNGSNTAAAANGAATATATAARPVVRYRPTCCMTSRPPATRRPSPGTAQEDTTASTDSSPRLPGSAGPGRALISS